MPEIIPGFPWPLRTWEELRRDSAALTDEEIDSIILDQLDEADMKAMDEKTWQGNKERHRKA